MANQGFPSPLPPVKPWSAQHRTGVTAGPTASGCLGTKEDVAAKCRPGAQSQLGAEDQAGSE